MPWRMYTHQQPSISPAQDLVPILLAVIVALIIWNSFWSLAKLALFIAIVYMIYYALKRYF